MTDLQSLFFYVILFVLSAILINYSDKTYNNANIKNRKIKSVLLATIGILIPILIGAFRFKVGTDYMNYVNDFYIRKNMYDYELFNSFNIEILFLLIQKIAIIINDYQLMFAICSFLTILIMYKAILSNKGKSAIGLVFFLYLFLHYTTSFNIIRQGVAITIVAFSYKFIFTKEFKKYILCIILASMFHLTAIFFLPVYLINAKNKFTRKHIKWIFFVIIILGILNYNTILNFFATSDSMYKYSAYTINNTGNNREIILNTLILIVVLLIKKPLEKYDDKNKLYIYFLIINWILSFTGIISPYIKRIAMYFGISDIFILASIPNILKNKKQKMLVLFIIILYGFSIFIISTYILKQANIIPYQTIFNK